VSSIPDEMALGERRGSHRQAQRFVEGVDATRATTKRGNAKACFPRHSPSNNGPSKKRTADILEASNDIITPWPGRRRARGRELRIVGDKPQLRGSEVEPSPRPASRILPRREHGGSSSSLASAGNARRKSTDTTRRPGFACRASESSLEVPHSFGGNCRRGCGLAARARNHGGSEERARETQRRPTVKTIERRRPKMGTALISTRDMLREKSLNIVRLCRAPHRPGRGEGEKGETECRPQHSLALEERLSPHLGLRHASCEPRRREINGRTQEKTRTRGKIPATPGGSAPA